MYHEKSAFARAAAGTPLYVAGKVHPVASLLGDLLTKCIRPEHILNKPPALCFDVDLLRQAAKLGARRVQVTCSDGRTFRCLFDDLRAHGHPIDRGYGKQWALVLDRWSINGAVSEEQRRAEAEAAKGAQLSLFEAVTA